MIEKIRKTPKVASISILLFLSIVVIVLYVKNMIPVQVFENSQAYLNIGIGVKKGIFVRFFLYIIGFLMIFSFINLLSKKEHKYTKYGRRTVVIYIASAFLVKAIFNFLNKTTIVFLSNHLEIGFIIACAITVITIILFGNDWIYNRYMLLINLCSKVFMKNNE